MRIITSCGIFSLGGEGGKRKLRTRKRLRRIFQARSFFAKRTKPRKDARHKSIRHHHTSVREGYNLRKASFQSFRILFPTNEDGTVFSLPLQIVTPAPPPPLQRHQASQPLRLRLARLSHAIPNASETSKKRHVCRINMLFSFWKTQRLAYLAFRIISH